MSALGIANTMRIAHAYYWLKFRRNDEWRRSLYREQFTDLLEENGPVGRPSIQIKDGYAIDTSMSLALLQQDAGQDGISARTFGIYFDRALGVAARLVWLP